ncbi:MAG: deoxyribonuclease IV [Ignavibacteriae bacterium]|nr:deoxyribonuclease IV [Ignavibacteria bacterium]MBI3363274.1 deoxyribonuclease IV [Ignavibacteriota bacterium]
MADSTKPLIGAHQSIAGGIHKAFERAKQVGCTALQVFTKNSNQWNAKPLTDEDIASYKMAASKSTIIAPVVAHDSYLINLCAKDTALLQRSRRAFVDELKRCEALGIPYLNFHPGAHTGQGEEEGITRIIESLNWAHEETKGFKVKSVLETTAGQGSAIGYRFEHLQQIIDGVDEPERMAVCIDTCHIFAAGYDISTEKGYDETMKEFDAIIGLERLAAIHTNDSKKPLGSRVDRHEHIGKGAIGELGFRMLMQDERLANIPKILETPKGEDLKEDKMNLSVLRKLAEGE